MPPLLQSSKIYNLELPVTTIKENAYMLTLTSVSFVSLLSLTTKALVLLNALITSTTTETDIANHATSPVELAQDLKMETAKLASSDYSLTMEIVFLLAQKIWLPINKENVLNVVTNALNAEIPKLALLALLNTS
jgi:hypothetical protein